MMFYRRPRVRRFPWAAALGSSKTSTQQLKPQQVPLLKGALGSGKVPSGLGKSWVH